MKKTLVIGLISLGAIISSYGTGYVYFDNYTPSPYMPVVYGSSHGALAGQSVADPNVHVDLLYFIGTTSNPSQLTDLHLSVPISSDRTDSFGNYGYFFGPAVFIPGYVSGPVTFEVEAWQRAGPFGGATYAASLDRGVSALWQESSLQTILYSPSPDNTLNYFAGLPGPDRAPLLAINLIPEPSAYALSALGAACLLLARRKSKT
jgi:hypothetical protein